MKTKLKQQYDLTEKDEVNILKGDYPSINKSKLQAPAVLCNEPLYDKVDFYDLQYDLPLSGFLLTQATTLFSKCKNCEIPKYRHVDLYY